MSAHTPDPRRPGPQPPGPDDAPDRPWLTVVPARLPPEGGEVTVVLVNPTDREQCHGVLGRLQRREGEQWVDHRQVTTGAGPDRPAGRLHPTDAEIMVVALALCAPPHGSGPPVRTRLEGLSTGSYRFVLGAATGRLEITDDAPPAAEPPVPPTVPPCGPDVARARPDGRQDPR